MRYCLPLKGSTFATVALAGKGGAVAGLGYRDPNSRRVSGKTRGHTHARQGHARFNIHAFARAKAVTRVP